VHRGWITGATLATLQCHYDKGDGRRVSQARSGFDVHTKPARSRGNLRLIEDRTSPRPFASVECHAQDHTAGILEESPLRGVHSAVQRDL